MKRARRAWLFFFLMLLAWAAIRWSAPEAAGHSGEIFTGLLLNVLPPLALVVLLQFLVNLYVDRAWLTRHLGRGSGLAGRGVAVAAGVLATGPAYAWYPFAGELKNAGVRPGLIAAFLYAVGVKLPLLPLLVHYFGLSYALALTGWMIVFALLNGVIGDRFEGCRTPEASESSRIR